MEDSLEAVMVQLAGHISLQGSAAVSGSGARVRGEVMEHDALMRIRPVSTKQIDE